MSDQKQYAERDIRQLDKLGNYFSRHMLALTAEDLYSKADIAAELAWRDAELDRLNTELRAKAEAQAVLAEFFTYSLGGIECVCLRGQPVYFWSFQADRGGLGKTYADMLATELNKLKLYTAPPAQAASLTTPTLNASCVPEGCYHLTLDKYEVEALADYHDYQQENAYSCGMECEGDKIRSAELRAMLAAAPQSEQPK